MTAVAIFLKKSVLFMSNSSNLTWYKVNGLFGKANAVRLPFGRGVGPRSSFCRCSTSRPFRPSSSVSGRAVRGCCSAVREGSCRLIPGPDDCVECWAGFARKMRYSREGPYRAASENFAQDRDRADRVDRIEMVAEKDSIASMNSVRRARESGILAESVGFALHQGAQ